MRPTVRLPLLVVSLLAATAHAGPVDDLRTYLARPAADRPPLAGQAFATTPLSKADAATAAALLWADHVTDVRLNHAADWAAGVVRLAGKTMKFNAKTYGTRPAAGWDLYLSMHGGGNAPAAVNDQQWDNQGILYSPPNSLYISPRAPTDTWNLWHESHIDPMFARLIADAIVLGGANPNRVYLMGYSAGGDGVYQLAPRMADEFAAAAMMAGHPNDASPLGLRNLPFAIHVGALDDGYDRNKIAAEWKTKLDNLQKTDPAGYTHEVVLHAGRGHWMNREDAVAVPWMARFTRDPLPDKVVWNQGHAVHDRFYWLAVPPGTGHEKTTIVARRQGQTVTIETVDGVEHFDVLLNDAMLDLDRPVRVERDGKPVFEGVVPRTIETLAATTADRGDPAAVYSARLGVPAAN